MKKLTDKQILEKYGTKRRIVFDGHKYKIQEYILYGWWFWKKWIWQDYVGGYWTKTYGKLEEANEKLERLNRADVIEWKYKQESYEWRPV